ncbi:alpha/beta hydrolase fold domain-containing protein [Sarocladium implicatum]|nr:alpha/beta hydrolase fold domain-containing protein [Sarocladium implicatum]
MKEHPWHNLPNEPPSVPRGHPVWAGLLTVVSLVLLWFQWSPSSIHAPRTASSSLNWSEIPPSSDLQWHQCYDAQFECARLDLSMDWQDPNVTDRVVIAVARLRAKNITDYKGSVFFNPGGPGGSGIWALQDHGDLIQAVVGDNHDIITFDPRGIGFSVPRVECWKTPQQRWAWDAQESGIVSSHEGMIYDIFARAIAFSQACERNTNETNLLSHLSTASHARDMLEILDQLGEEKLKYWGFSYGTILGGTFAAMYPDRVGRLVSDGNVDYREWHHGTHINFLRDTDKVMDGFYLMCHEAGPLKCALYEDTAEKIESRLEVLLDDLRIRPVAALVTVDGYTLPELITYSKVRKAISAALYRPIQKFAPLAKALAALESGDGVTYQSIIGPNANIFLDSCNQNSTPPTTPSDTLSEGTDDAFPAIMCSDAEPLTETVVEFEEYAKALQEISTVAGAVNVLFRISCAGRTIRPKWRFSGPFAGNTSFPILFIANVADNVTPLVSARNNSQGFEGSVVLVQNSLGHTSLAAPSTCTALHIRSYFQEGILPPPGTECEPDKLPFDLTPAEIDFDDSLTPAIRALSERVWGTGGAM